MHYDLNINIQHLARIEGHGNIVLDMEAGEIKQLHLDIVESPRFFEALLKGRHFNDVPHITSRICGICSVGHTMASVRACENAAGIEVSEDVVKIRKLLTDAAFLQSHVLHLFFLVAPDVLGVGSVIPLAQSNPELVKQALAMKKFTNDVCDVLGGRTVHPINIVPGGLARYPSRKELQQLREEYQRMWPSFAATVDIFAELDYPQWFMDFDQPTEYVSLTHEVEYPLYQGQVTSSAGKTVAEHDYLDLIQERVEPHSAAKHVRALTETYTASALARFNNNYDRLHPLAKQAAEKLGMPLPTTNPFFNIMAQTVEVIHCMQEDLQLLDELIAAPPKPEPLLKPTHFGRGTAAVEVPRGLLFHDYHFNDEGVMEQANCIIPTGQNLANVEADLHALVPKVLDLPKEDIQLALEMLVRAYDPCISCATHVLNVEFV